jgi:glycogen synthase
MEWIMLKLVEPLLSQVRGLNFANEEFMNADKINAVSEQYADEILTEEFGMGLHKNWII